MRYPDLGELLDKLELAVPEPPASQSCHPERAQRVEGSIRSVFATF